MTDDARKQKLEKFRLDLQEALEGLTPFEKALMIAEAMRNNGDEVTVTCEAETGVFTVRKVKP